MLVDLAQETSVSSIRRVLIQENILQITNPTLEQSKVIKFAHFDLERKCTR